jgi:hypothetical protein
MRSILAFLRGVAFAVVAFAVALELAAFAGTLLVAAFTFEAGVSPIAD